MPLDRETLTEIWAQFVYEDRLDPRVQPAVAECWKKCKAAGVNPKGGLGRRVDDAVFRSILDANRDLIDTASPIMQSVFEVVERSHCLLVLTDSVGYILLSIGDAEIMRRTEDMRFVPGAMWSNLSVGTNAISVALDCDTAIQMQGPEHYCRSHHEWTCSAAPIHAGGQVIGCLNISGDISTVHPHTLGLVLAAAYGIEAQLSLRRNAEIMRSALENSSDSILFLGRNYRPIWLNSAARRLFGVSDEELERTDLRALLPDVDWASYGWSEGKKYFANDVRVRTDSGVVRCSAAIYPSMDNGERVLNVTLKKQKHLIDSVNKLSGNRASYTFEHICTRDPEMLKTVALAQKYAQYDGNILIEGESGTGKELFAQAIHNAGARGQGPFVAINCASIPRDLLEYELFGYEAGAALGGATEGNPGRFELANNGTLFLDEISELPLELQSKLLRTVETHAITRLGGGQEIELNIRIVAATNRRLDDAVAAGSFRRDLYYRLNVLKLEIPPLRERRGDISYCAEEFLKKLNDTHDEAPRSMSREFLEGLLEYDWPGNVRELQNGIERAFYASPEPLLDSSSLRCAIDAPAGGGAEETAGRLSGQAGEIYAALTVCGGDVELSASKLGVSRATLYRRLKKYGIDPKSLR